MRKFYFFSGILFFFLSGLVVPALAATSSFSDTGDYIWKNSVNYLRDNSVIEFYSLDNL